MNTYKFHHADGKTTTVEANDEADAREEAMTLHHGNPRRLTFPVPNGDKYTTIGHNGYTGSGLHLLRVS